MRRWTGAANRVYLNFMDCVVITQGSVVLTDVRLLLSRLNRQTVIHGSVAGCIAGDPVSFLDFMSRRAKETDNLRRPVLPSVYR